MATKKIIPKGCWVRRIELTSKGADVGYDCNDDQSGGRGNFPLPGGGWSNYRSTFVKHIRSVHHRGIGVSGHGAAMGFVLSPASATCERSDKFTLRCKLEGDTSSPSLAGYRKRRKSRR